LFLARAVLQCLCVGAVGDANRIFEKYTSHFFRPHGGKVAECGPFPLPMCNFLRFLLLTCERGPEVAPLYKTLIEHYGPSLARDETFQTYAQHIGKAYFGIPTQPKGLQGMLGGMLSSLLGGEDEG